MIDEANYTDLHIHPVDPTVVEFVAYERIDGSWDVFVFAPPGSCPELDAKRVDEYHIFIKRIKDKTELNEVVDEIETFLGDGYKRSPYYREFDTRQTIQKILQHLKQHDAHGMFVHNAVDNEWVLYIRNKDFNMAQEIVASNL